MIHSAGRIGRRWIDAGTDSGRESCSATSIWRRGFGGIIRCGRSGRSSNEALAALQRGLRGAVSRMGRPSIPPEQLLRAMLLQAFYSVRSERQLMERLEFDLLFRWFVGLGDRDAVWDHSTFSKNRDRLLAGEIAGRFLAAVLAQPRVKRLLSSEHFSVDGTLIEAWASMKSFRPKEPAGGAARPPASGPPAAAATPRSTSRARSARTRRTPRRPTPTRCSTARGPGWRRGCASSATG